MFEFRKVKEFNDKIIKLKSTPFLNKERREWFKTVVNEELTEFMHAHDALDRVGMLDAIIDLIFFIIGRAQELGFTESQFERAFDAVYKCNLRKDKGNKGRGSDTDATKPADWIGPEEKIKSILETDAPCESDIIDKIPDVFKEVTRMAIKKSQDYNNGADKPQSRANYFPFGLLSYAQMLHTKTQRLNSLAQQIKKPNNESIRDTLLDLINYASFAVEAIDKGEI